MRRSVLIILLFALLFILILGASVLYPKLAERFGGEETAEEGSYTETPESAALREGTASDFTVYDSGGEEVHLSDFFGEPIVVNFWASWCPPCRSELPAFNAAFSAYDGRVHFLMVDLADGQRETQEIAEEYLSENGFAFPVYFDSALDAAYTYGVYSIPMTLFIRADGVLAASYTGAMSEETLVSNIESLLDQ